MDLEAYVIHGHNYVQLRDVGRAVDFGVAYDQGTNRVLVDTSSPYTEESAAPAPSGVVTIPQSDEPLRLKEGDKVLCDDGTTYEITDLRLWEEPESLPAYDQTRFPELELPKAGGAEVPGVNTGMACLSETSMRRGGWSTPSTTPRVNCPELWADGSPRPQPAPGHLCTERGADVLALAGRPAYPSILLRAGGPVRGGSLGCVPRREISLYRI